MEQQEAELPWVVKRPCQELEARRRADGTCVISLHAGVKLGTGEIWPRLRVWQRQADDAVCVQRSLCLHLSLHSAATWISFVCSCIHIFTHFMFVPGTLPSARQQ
jgi:hypothetical protein